MSNSESGAGGKQAHRVMPFWPVVWQCKLMYGWRLRKWR